MIDRILSKAALRRALALLLFLFFSGSAFGAEGYARVSFATSLENLQAGFDRIETFLKER